MGQLKIRENQRNHAQDIKCPKKRIQGYKEMLQYEIQKSQCTFGISANEEILAYQFNSNRIKIANLKTSLNVKQIYTKENEAKGQDTLIQCFGYFENSRMMYCMNNHRIKIYRADNKYKQINTVFSQNGCIYDIKLINKSQILTCCKDRSIMVTDLTTKSQILQIPKSQNSSISQIEFDPSNQAIISYSFDKSIKLYKMNGDNIINYEGSDFYYQIQLISNSHMIGRSHMSLVLWKIDYQQRQLIKLKEFNNQRIIYRISSFLSSGIILLDSKDIIILNTSDLKVVHKQKHKVKNIIYDRNSKLTTNSNDHLIITCFGFLKVLKKIL